MLHLIPKNDFFKNPGSTFQNVTFMQYNDLKNVDCMFHALFFFFLQLNLTKVIQGNGSSYVQIMSVVHIPK